MPRWLRILLTAWSFFLFFGGSPVLGIVVLPILRLFAKDREDHRRRCTRLIGRGFRFFTAWCTFARHLEAPREIPVLPELVSGRPYVLIANHPSLIDIFFLLGSYDGLTCVAKGSWFKSLVLGPLLRQTHYLAGPRSGQEETEDMLGSMIAHLEHGHPLLVFPEGSRSHADRLRRFRRGAVEAAVRARVPIVALFLSVDRPYLMKGVPFWKVPSGTPRFGLELVEVIDTSGIAIEDAKKVNAELAARYQTRFARMLAERVEGRVLPPSGEARAAA